MNGQRLLLDDRQRLVRSPHAACKAQHTPAGRLSVQQLNSKNVLKRPGFSLLELLIVIAVSVVLAGLLFPALANLRENAYRVVCASNQRQIGIAMMMYERDYSSLPYSRVLTSRAAEPRHLDLANLGGEMSGDRFESWDGVGRLFAAGYCRAPNCFYCPSHKGQHRIDRELEDWYFLNGEPIYTNFHYSGHIDWVTGHPRDLSRVNQADRHLVLLTDGLRSLNSLNHADGLNMLMGDGSVRWRESLNDIENLIPLRDDQALTNAQERNYREIWGIIESDDSHGF